jgi:hypothetical protein
MIKKPPPFTGKEKPKDDKPNLPIDFGVNYAIVIAVILALYPCLSLKYQL